MSGEAPTKRQRLEETPSAAARNGHSPPPPEGPAPAPAQATPDRRKPASGIPGFSEDAPVHRVVLTGGPCAGKSTLLATLQTSVEERTGVKVFCVPEAATLLVTGGLQWTDMTEEKVVEYQLALLRVQMALEDNFYSIAKAYGGPALIVCDRGTMDGRAYSTQEQFDEIMRRGGFTRETLRDERYDAVVHLVSASVGAEHHYNMDNPARFESVLEAQQADERLRHMYIGHPRLKIIDNSTPSFREKLDRAIDFVYEVIGHSKPKHMRRFMVRNAPTQDKMPVPSVAVSLSITVLSGSSPACIRFLLRREQGVSVLYTLHQIERDADAVGDTGRTEMRHNISAREYANLVQQRDPNHVEVVKTGLSFTFRSHFFELSVFTSPEWCLGDAMLYTDCTDLADLPPWLETGPDTTDDTAYSSFNLSRRRDAPPFARSGSGSQSRLDGTADA